MPGPHRGGCPRACWGAWEAACFKGFGGGHDHPRKKRQRERETDGDLGYLAGPRLGMVFSEPDLRGMGRGVVDRGFCSEHGCSPQLLGLCSGNSSLFAMGSTWKEVNVEA